jgi:alanine dehydrogenase
MKPDGTLLLKRQEVAELLTLEECIAAIEQVFKLQGEGRTATPGVLGIHARDGGFHIKAGLLELSRPYFVAKANANFPQNMKRYGLPLIQGIIVLCDGVNGYLLALMDSTEITTLRTGAATAVAAKYLSRPDSKVATICGCGNQGRISLKALMKVRPLERANAFDYDGAQAEHFARELSIELGVELKATADLAAAVGESDICVTCTPSKQYFLNREYVSAGTFIAAVGADNEEKQELDPALLQHSKIIVDLLEQCASIGDLHHALVQGLVTREDVHAELGEVIAGLKTGRESAEEIIVFDSTGMALQDVVATVAVYERALSTDHAARMNFFA